MQACAGIKIENSKTGLEEIIELLHNCLLKARNQVENDLIKAVKHIKRRRDNRRDKPPINGELREIYELKALFNKKWLTTGNYNFRQISNAFRSRARKLEKAKAKQQHYR